MAAMRRGHVMARLSVLLLFEGVARGARPPGLAEDGLPLEVPAFIADVRIGQGQVTLYKSIRAMSRRILVVDDEQGIRRRSASCSSTRGTRCTDVGQRRGRDRRVRAVPPAPRLPGREDGRHRRPRGAEAAAAERSRRRRRDDQRSRDDSDRGRGDAARRLRHSREAARHRPHSRHAAERARSISTLHEENARLKQTIESRYEIVGTVLRDHAR